MTCSKISAMSWGEIVMEDGPIFKDVMLAPGLIQEWDWRKSGTSHTKGIQISDIDFLIDHGIEALVLSRGYEVKLTISEATLKYAKSKLKKVLYGQSEAAVAEYNRLVKSGSRVGALIHSTC